MTILQIQRAGHALAIDIKGDTYRVICNGTVYATFSCVPFNEIEGLKQAAAHVEGMETKCLASPKPGFEV